MRTNYDNDDYQIYDLNLPFAEVINQDSCVRRKINTVVFL